MHSVEIAKDVMPTIGLHAIRLPSGAVTEKLHETANNLYAVVSGTVRATIDGQADEVPRTRRRSGSARCGMDTSCMVLRTRRCCGSLTSRSWPSSASCATVERSREPLAISRLFRPMADVVAPVERTC